jgi:hypothetical protein
VNRSHLLTAGQSARLRRDQEILLRRYPNRVSWDFGNRETWFFRINDVALPQGCRPRTTHMKIIVPPTIYMSVAGRPGRFVNWRDVYVDPGLRLRQRRQWVVPPRYSDMDDGLGWHYLCLHLHPADATSTVLDFVEAVRVHLATYAAA